VHICGTFIILTLAVDLCRELFEEKGFSLKLFYCLEEFTC
jgi:hypothetical protein